VWKLISKAIEARKHTSFFSIIIVELLYFSNSDIAVVKGFVCGGEGGNRNTFQEEHAEESTSR